MTSHSKLLVCDYCGTHSAFEPCPFTAEQRRGGFNIDYDVELRYQMRVDLWPVIRLEMIDQGGITGGEMDLDQAIQLRDFLSAWIEAQKQVKP